MGNVVKTQDDRLDEIEVTQAALRANIQQSQKMIERSRELLEKQARGGRNGSSQEGAERAAS
jgi:hypothetical protein